MLADTLPSAPTFYLVATLAVVCLGLSKAGIIGFGLLGTPLLALVVPPLQAAAILLPIMLIQDAFSVWAFRDDWDKPTVAVTVSGAVFGIAAAWLLAAHVSDAAVRLGVGLIALAFVLNHWLGRRVRNGRDEPDGSRRPAVGAGVFWGAVAGFTGTLANAGGPPFLVYVLPRRLPKMTLVGTMAVFFGVINAMKVVPYAALGQFSADSLAVSSALIPAALASNALGIWLVRRIPPALFYRLAYVLVLVISLELTRQGLGGILAG